METKKTPDNFSPKIQSFGGVIDPVAGNWSTSVVEVPSDRSLVKERGSLFVVLALSGLKGEEEGAVGQTLANALKEDYYSQLDGSPLRCLEEAVVAAQERFQGTTSGAASAGAPSLKVDLVAGVLWGRVLYLVQLGETVAVLLRGGETKYLGKKSSGSSSTASGLVEEGDVLILGSSAVKKRLGQAKPEDILSLVEEEPSTRSVDPLLSGLVLRFDPLESEKTERVLFRSSDKLPPLSQVIALLKYPALALGLLGTLLLGWYLYPKIGEFSKGKPPATTMVSETVVAEETKSDEGLQVIKPSLLYDLSLEGSASHPSFIIGSGTGAILVADSGLGTVFSVLSSGAEKLLSEKVAGVWHLFLGEGRYYLLTEGSIFKLQSGEDTLEELTLSPELSWGGVVGVDSYLGNLYFLLPGQEIRKYVPVVGGFGEGASWLEEGEELPADVVDLAVDGDIWVVERSGLLHKYSFGEKQAFAVEGLPSPLKDATSLYTREELDNLYLLDRSRRRVVVISKDGQYVTQFGVNVDFEGWQDLRTLWVESDGGKIYILDGTKIWLVD